MKFYNKAYTIKVAIFASVITMAIAVYTVSLFIPSETIYIAPPQVDKVEEKTKAIYESKEFQEEMQLKAKARALYALSNDTQSVAVDYAEKAQDTFYASEELSDKWFSSNQ